ncbi:MAG: undecaprenyl-diphosphate phosphatase [Hymenobacter sp.]
MTSGFRRRTRRRAATPSRQPGYREAFTIGVFQCLAVVPGVSRSAATIIGGLTQKLTRKAAAEFAFFLAMPTMAAASVKDVYDYYKEAHAQGVELSQLFTGQEIKLLLLGNVVAFVVALLAIRLFVGFVTKYGFRAFGIYRIICGRTALADDWAGPQFATGLVWVRKSNWRTLTLRRAKYCCLISR